MYAIRSYYDLFCNFRGRRFTRNDSDFVLFLSVLAEEQAESNYYQKGEEYVPAET